MRVTRTNRLRATCALGLAWLTLGAGSPARADGPSKDKQEAKTLVRDATKASASQRWAEAAEALARADALDPDPQTKLELARALIPIGRLVEASRALNGVVASATRPQAKKQLDAAQRLLRAIEPRIPWLTVVVQPDADAKVAIDGHDIDAKSGIPVDPGEHVVTAQAANFMPAQARVQLAEGEHEQVTIRLQPTASPVLKEPDRAGSVLPAVLAFGVGAAGIGVGTAFGIMAFDETSKVERDCRGTRCPRRVEPALDVAKTNGTISTIAFIAGGLGVAGGVVLLLASGGSARSDGADAAAHVRPYIGPGNAGVTGAF